MTTTRETALEALQTTIASAVSPIKILRNQARPVEVAAEPRRALLILRDGDPGTPEQTFGVITYYWQHVAELDILVQRDDEVDRTVEIDAIVQAIDAQIEADKTLGGVVQYTRPQGTLVDHDQDDAGTVPYGTGLMLIELWYETTSSVG